MNLGVLISRDNKMLIQMILKEFEKKNVESEGWFGYPKDWIDIYIVNILFNIIEYEGFCKKDDVKSAFRKCIKPLYDAISWLNYGDLDYLFDIAWESEFRKDNNSKSFIIKDYASRKCGITNTKEFPLYAAIGIGIISTLIFGMWGLAFYSMYICFVSCGGKYVEMKTLYKYLLCIVGALFILLYIFGCENKDIILNVVMQYFIVLFMYPLLKPKE